MDQPPRVQLLISIDHAGRLQVSGPLDDVLTCYGLLGMAGDAIRARTAKIQQTPVVAPPPGVNGQRLRITE